MRVVWDAPDVHGGAGACGRSGVTVSDPLISIVVCSRNRASGLRATLDYYERLTAPFEWELVVVDNASTDETLAMLTEYVKTSAVAVSVVSEPQAGLCRARNAGWRAARGRIVAFSDDDCYPEENFVEALMENFGDGDLGYLGGRVLLFDRDDFPITIQTMNSRRDILPGEFVEAGLIHGANLASRKAVLERIGGFDEALGAGTQFPGGDDVDFVNRASAAGFSGAYDPRPVVLHHHRRRKDEDVAALVRGYNIGRGAYFMKAVLDPGRRAIASRQWYWRTFLRAWRSRSEARRCIQEMHGAMRWLVHTWKQGRASAGGGRSANL